MPGRRIVILVHGCCRHRHPGRRFGTPPSTRVAFRSRRFGQDVARDARKQAALLELGWRVGTMRKCQVRTGVAGDTVSTLSAWIERSDDAFGLASPVYAQGGAERRTRVGSAEACGLCGHCSEDSPVYPVVRHGRGSCDMARMREAAACFGIMMFRRRSSRRDVSMSLDRSKLYRVRVGIPCTRAAARRSAKLRAAQGI